MVLSIYVVNESWLPSCFPFNSIPASNNFLATAYSSDSLNSIHIQFIRYQSWLLRVSHYLQIIFNLYRAKKVSFVLLESSIVSIVRLQNSDVVATWTTSW